jgi:alpha-mannosidase
LGSLGAVAGWPFLAKGGPAGESPTRFCVVLCNHWSYTGIGWQLGLESNVLSVLDAMGVVDRPPHVKTCLNLDARAYERMAEKFPEVAARLKSYLAAGKLELIGGTYGQPMGTTIGSESNIRQLVVGREAIRQALGYEMATFLEEEEFTHPQVPQLAAGAGYRYASLAQLDTWGRTGIPILEQNVIRWQGVDGTTIPSVPKHSLSLPGVETKQLADAPAFKKLAALGTPLLFGWEEFGWEDPEHPAYLAGSERQNPLPDLYAVEWGTLKRFQALAAQYQVEFVTLREYLEKYGADPKQTIALPMEAFNKWLTWGLGGDQVRILDRKVEGLLLAAELLDAVVAGLGGDSQGEALERAWKDLLASQSHDVGLCEYSRWQGDRMAPLDRIEDTHNFAWGALGYNLLDSAQNQGRAVLDSSLRVLAGKVNSRKDQQGPLAVTVFNALGHQRKDLALTGRIYPLPEQTRDLVIKNRAGHTLPSQLIKAEQDREGNLVMAELAFPAAQVPSAGYDTYYLEPVTSPQPGRKTDLVLDEARFRLENEYLRVELDPVTGAVASLVHKPSGRETVDGKRVAFPRFTGKPNPNLSRRPDPPANYDSAMSKGRLDWVAKGPLLATVRAHHRWKYLNFETRVTLAAGQPYVEVVSRVFAQVPPLFTGTGPLDLNSGYWLSFAPAFEVRKVVRDYPLAVEATEKSAFHALTFADLIGQDAGLLVLHPGTQWFCRDPKGSVGNLIMREWESLFTNEYGWPLYSEYRHALWPHGPEELSNAARLRAAAGLARPLLCYVEPVHGGKLQPSRSFVRVTPETLLLSTLRKKPGRKYELRVLENEGKAAESAVEIGLPMATAVETDLLGRKTKAAAFHDHRLTFQIDPWKFRTFELG